MSSAPVTRDRFLSLIPENHSVAVLTDGTPVESAVESAPQSPAAQPIDKARRSSSTASAESVPGDMVSAVQSKQFLKLGQ